MSSLVFYAFCFIFGLFVGSFLNVVADRLVSGESIWFGRSHCDFCQKILGAIDLVPVLSFFSTFGLCRYCKQKLSITYPLSEVLTGGMFLLSAFSARVFVGDFYIGGRSLLMFAYFVIVSCFYIIIFLADAKYQIIPTKVVVPAIIFVGAFYLILGFEIADLISAFSLGGFFWGLYIVTKGKGMGFGDVRLALLIGLFNRFPNNVLAIFMSFISGAVFSVILMIFGKKGMKDKIAFGPFMLLGSVLAFILGDVFFSWYL